MPQIWGHHTLPRHSKTTFSSWCCGMLSKKKWTKSQRVLCSKRTTLGTDSHIELLSFPLFTPALDLYMISCPWNPLKHLNRRLLGAACYWLHQGTSLFPSSWLFGTLADGKRSLSSCESMQWGAEDRLWQVWSSQAQNLWSNGAIPDLLGKPWPWKWPYMTISNQLLSNCLNLALSFNIQKCRIATTCGIPGEKNNNCYGCMRVNQRHEHFGRIVDEHTAIILQTSFSLPTVR